MGCCSLKSLISVNQAQVWSNMEQYGNHGMQWYNFYKWP